MSPTIELTRGEAELVLHRLEAGDSLADVFEDDDRYGRGEVADACDRLAPMVAARRFETDDLSPCERDVLIDCIEGSTYVSVCLDESPQRGAAAYRVACGLADKLSAAGLTIVRVPNG